MDAGELKHRIIFQENIPVQTSSGTKDNWIDLAKRWASVQPLSSREFIAAQQSNSEISSKVKIRYSKLLDKPNLRAVMGTKIFILEAPINPSYMNKELIFMAKVKKDE